jgi:alkanesulfonate monooxygenase SsuD/methylene tetrahydromethanopterin reductase-like flavin-dependent oxidoreductase (luciferase family)
MDLNNAVVPRPQLSFACPPGGRSVEHSRIAESLGYERVWLFDSPSMYTDIWVSLARIADATERIGLGTGVAVPSTRHPMVTASAIAAVEELAPGRLVVAFGPVSRPGSPWRKSQCDGARSWNTHGKCVHCWTGPLSR